MRITAQEEYGLRCLLQLARNASGSHPLTVGEVARREGLSAAYAEKLLRSLGRAHLAESVRGVRGGYRIARAPESVTVGEALRALGGILTRSSSASGSQGKTIAASTPETAACVRSGAH